MGVPNLSTSVVAYDSSVYGLCWEGGEPEYDGALAQWVTTNARKDHTKTLIFISSIKTWISKKKELRIGPLPDVLKISSILLKLGNIFSSILQAVSIRLIAEPLPFQFYHLL